MKDYVIEVISSLIIVLLIFIIADWFDIKWLQGGTIRILLILPVTLFSSRMLSYLKQKRRLN